ncbi:MAG: tagaturonate epimerase family protein [Phycisphaerae bacterium]
MIDKLREVTGLEIYEQSVHETDTATYFMARRGGEKFIGCVGDGGIKGDKTGDVDGKPVIVGATSHENAEAIRDRLPFAGPMCVGLHTSLGFGDRLGLATPGHIRAVRGTHISPVLAQQSIREMKRTRRTPEEVMDAATWGVMQEGYRDTFGSDADHLQQPLDIDRTAEAGFTMFTIDPGEHVDDEADDRDPAALAGKLEGLDTEPLEATADDLRKLYVDRTFPLEGGGEVSFDEETFLRAAAKYAGAVAHTVRMYRHLREKRDEGEFELEVSVDETETPTSPEEHYFIAAELKRLGVQWVSLAPRFVGRFEKGVDYIGDLDEFRRSFARHAAVMRTVGPYKISIHSGSDKFSIYPIVAELTEGLVHVKTAGTSYLAALKAIAETDPGLFREIIEFARKRYETDKATYHVSADISRVPATGDLPDDALGELTDHFDARQMLHVTFGSVLTEDDGGLFGSRISDALRGDEETHYEAVRSHLRRHVEPFLYADE